ncbi:MAG: hypothetical protein DWB56_07720 [Candidatus Jettenia sp.]|nr:MAG: hypothetical protein EDM77_04685 [Candidatus Jettenia sp. AMX1]MBC6928834.1 hypothetical protein [Candidatus Jettenia sp.]MCE7881041.1 hypothetical protein [Candidatus Jettenia sp. AMX1]
MFVLRFGILLFFMCFMFFVVFKDVGKDKFLKGRRRISLEKGNQGGLRVVCYSSPFPHFSLMHMRTNPIPVQDIQGQGLSAPPFPDSIARLQILA